jgi:hypothetical protein
MSEYYIGQIAFKKVTRGSVVLGLELKSIFESRLEVHEEDKVLMDKLYTAEEFNNHVPHHKALEYYFYERFRNNTLKRKGVRKNKSMIKVGRDPTLIHCSLKMDKFIECNGNGLRGVDKLAVGTCCIVKVDMRREYRYELKRIRLFSDIISLIDHVSATQWLSREDGKCELSDFQSFPFCRGGENACYVSLLRRCLDYDDDEWGDAATVKDEE